MLPDAKFYLGGYTINTTYIVKVTDPSIRWWRKSTSNVDKNAFSRLTLKLRFDQIAYICQCLELLDSDVLNLQFRSAADWFEGQSHFGLV